MRGLKCVDYFYESWNEFTTSMSGWYGEHEYLRRGVGNRRGRRWRIRIFTPQTSTFHFNVFIRVLFWWRVLKNNAKKNNYTQTDKISMMKPAVCQSNSVREHEVIFWLIPLVNTEGFGLVFLWNAFKRRHVFVFVFPSRCLNVRQRIGASVSHACGVPSGVPCDAEKRLTGRRLFLVSRRFIQQMRLVGGELMMWGHPVLQQLRTNVTHIKHTAGSRLRNVRSLVNVPPLEGGVITLNTT